MKKYLPLLLALLLILSALVACGGADTAEPAVEEPVAEVEEAQPEPTEVPEEPTAEPKPTAEPEPTEEPEPTAEPEPEVVEADSAALNEGFAAFLADMDHYNTIGLEDLNLALAEDPPPFLLDVREPGCRLSVWRQRRRTRRLFPSPKVHCKLPGPTSYRLPGRHE